MVNSSPHSLRSNPNNKFFTHVLIYLVGLGYLQSAERPNILWITSEDNGIKWVSCYGSKNALTPNIDQLAKEGFRYTHCFDNAAVCAPTRSTWITGHYAISLGTQPMRSRYLIPHNQIPYYPDLLKKAGYHIGNGGKTDYNIGGREDHETWQGGGSWSKRKPDQKFFSIKNIGDSHESNAFPKKHPPTTDPAKMVLHPYHPDLPEMRETYARYVDGIVRMDNKVGDAIAQLKKDGLYEDTIIVYCSDHGGVLPRSKRFLYSSGIHCPLVVRIPEKWKLWWPAEKPGMTVDRIVSFVDMPKTWLSLAGAEVPDSYQGKIFLGPDAEPEPKYHLSFRERADEACDLVRSMRDARYTYIKNYMPWTPNGQQLKYMFVMSGAQAWQQHFLEGKTNDITGRFFRPRSSEEFYDTEADFHNINNLIDDPIHQQKITELKKAMREKQLELFDSGLLPEAMRLRRAETHNLTIYEMVRNPELYPLEKYLDFTDLILAGDPKNLSILVESMSDNDEGIRYWAMCGLFLLENEATPAIEIVEKALEDECEEVQMMAAWTIDKLGKRTLAKKCIEKLFKQKPSDKRLFECVRRWMEMKSAGDIKSYVKDWKILGPFEDKSSRKVEAFAAALVPDAKWTPFDQGIGSEKLDIEAQLGAMDNCSAFVRTTVNSPTEQVVDLDMKCDDNVKAMLNGEVIDGEQLRLNRGNNQLILKLIENGGRWDFYCRITKDRKPVEGVTFVAE